MDLLITKLIAVTNAAPSYPKEGINLKFRTIVMPVVIEKIMATIFSLPVIDRRRIELPKAISTI
jgi:hypothetical protein